MRAADLPRRRGEPLIVLLAIALGWVTVRALAWQLPFAPVPAPGPEAPAVASPLASAPPEVPERSLMRLAQHRPARPVPDSRPAALPANARRAERASVQVRPAVAQALAAPSFVGPPLAPRIALPRVQRAAPSPVPFARSKRWHVDGWMAWRAGEGLPQPAAGPLALTYGGSQAGLLARFDLISSPRQPQAYLRALHAPGRLSQSDLALGVSARPLGEVPIRFQAEGRATRSQGGTMVRPALLAVTELAPVDLPLAFRAEAYAQAGWIGGRYATGFVDGQARIDRELLAAGPAKVRLGAGAWGGAQKSADRLDLGPTVTLDLRESAIPARLSIDYRHQVAGNARPGSGVAVTLSTGF